MQFIQQLLEARHTPAAVATIGSLAFGLFLWRKFRKLPGPKRRLTVVITGSTRGIGSALAEQFVLHGDNVVISGRKPEAVAAVVAELTQRFDATGRVAGLAADVTVAADLERLATYAEDTFGSLDLWINNAGVSLSTKLPLAECNPEDLRSVVETNLLGTMYGCHAALKVMLRKGRGHVFNMDGSGSWGNPTPNYAVYGASKAAIPQLTKSLVAETKGTGVGVHTASPGMVITDLLLSGNRDARTLRVFNILAEEPTTVAQWLVPTMRATTGSGTYPRYLTPLGAAWRFMTFWTRANRFFDSRGQRVVHSSVIRAAHESEVVGT
eukprot:TRINITY_DN5255_c0_g2_i1.p2 TRINITY_DN5255_c0_g2~~TRINITY_DN5255_c0_g2_i1.p2  ORF type:complete len:324 (-),score=90.74 TRINITY_DN5255_c0_g2_i1:8-979(-)